MKARIIDIRGEDTALHETFTKWWKAHDWPGVALAILPKCGVVIETDDGIMVCVGWLYMDNSVGVAMLEWVVTNPEVTAMKAYVGISTLVQSVKKVAAALEYGVVLTAVKQEALIRCYEKNGFKKSDDGMTHMIMLTIPKAE